MAERTKQSTGCKYNSGVCCDTPYPAACAGCGWNPAVSQKRVKNIIEKGAAKNETTD